MDINIVTGYFSQYGLLAVFVIVFLEYLNLPGFPAGIIMPLAGVMASSGHNSFLVTLLVSTAAGVLGSEMLYLLGRFGGKPFEKFIKKHFPKQIESVDKCLGWIREKGYTGVFLAKLIPAVRTLVSIPAGMVGLEPIKYTIYSALGVLIWNAVFVGAGYFIGDGIFAILARF